MTDLPEKLLTVNQASKLLGVSTKTLRRWDKSGALIPSRTRGNQRRYAVSQVENFHNLSSVVPKKNSTVDEASKLLGVSTKTLRRWDKSGILVPLRTKGNQRRYTPAQIENFLKTPKTFRTSDGVRVEAGVENKKVSPSNSNLLSFASQACYPIFRSNPNSVFRFVNPVAVFAAFCTIIILGRLPVFDKGKIAVKPIEIVAPVTEDQLIKSSVLASATVLDNKSVATDFVFNVNVPAYFYDTVDFAKDVTAQKITATGVYSPNLVYSVKAGSGITVTGKQEVTVANSGVLSLQGSAGALSLTAGSGISLDGLKIINTGITSLTAGDGITVDGSKITNSDKGSSQKIFKTIAKGTESFSATTNTDTLTFAEGTGIGISLDTTNKKITIHGTSGGTNTSGWTVTGSVVGLTTSTNNVGIGSSTTAAGLDVSKTVWLRGAEVNQGLFVSLGGNVGIGNTSPLYALDVSGGLRTSLGITAPNITLTTGAGDGKLLRSDASGNSVWSSLVAGAGVGITNVSGTITIHNLGGGASLTGGTTDYITKWSSPTSVVTSSIFDNGTNVGIFPSGNVGIGTSNPLELFQVGNLAGGTTPMIVKSNGFVGIGKTNPLTALDINGALRVNDGSYDSPTIRGSDNDTGFYFNPGNYIYTTINGSVTSITTNTGIYPKESAPAGLLSATATQTVPNIVPNADDSNTGMGWAGADVLSLISGGTNVLNVTAGNVGIKTINPSYPLDVTGIIRTTVGITTPSISGITSIDLVTNLNADMLDNLHASSFVQVGSTAGTVFGAGTSNYLSRWSSTANLITSSIFDNGTNIGTMLNVGIGNSSPLVLFSVGSTPTFPSLAVTSGGNVGIGTTNPTRTLVIADEGGNNSGISLVENTSGLASFSLLQSSTMATVNDGGVFSLFDGVGSTKVRFDARSNLKSYINAGCVGIGTTNPLQKLQVAGDINIESGSGIMINNTAASGNYLRGDGTRFVSSAIQSGDVSGFILGTANLIPKFTGVNSLGNSRVFDDGTNVGIGNTNPLVFIQIGNMSGGTAPMSILSSGRVGVGTTDPSSALSVMGGTGGSTNLFSLFSVAGGSVASSQETHRLYYDSDGDAIVDLYNSSGSNTVRLGTNGNSYLNGGQLSLGTGPFIIGDSAASGTNPAISLERTVTGASNAHGIQDYSNINLNATYAYAAYDVRNTMSGTASMDHFVGFQFSPIYNNSGTITQILGVTNLLTVQQGTITNFIQYKANNPNLTGGSIVNQYGFYVDETLEAATNNWAFYSEGTTQSYFGGNVGIGITAPIYKLHLNRSLSSATNTIYTLATLTAIHDGDMGNGFGGGIFLGIQDSAGTENRIGAIEAFRDGADNSGKIGLFTAKAGTFGNAKLLIDNNGNVGIGTTNSFGLFQVGSLHSGNTAGVIITSAGNVGIGTSIPVYKLELSSDSAAKPNGGSWTTTSDYRLKTEVKTIDNALGKMLDLKGVSFKWANPEQHGGLTTERIGFIAQDVEKVFPEWVGEVNPSGNDAILTSGQSAKTLTIFGFEALATEAFREQQILIASASSQLEKFKTEISDLKSDMELFKSGSLNASQSASLSLYSEEATFSGILVSGKANINYLAVTGNIVSGLLTIDGMDERDGILGTSISTLSGPLRLQASALGNIEIMAGKIIIDTKGNLVVQGTVTAKKYNVDESDVLSASLGEGEILIGSASAEIKTTAVLGKSRIFVTPKGKAVPLAILDQKEGESFMVGIGETQNEKILFNWWVIN